MTTRDTFSGSGNGFYRGKPVFETKINGRIFSSEEVQDILSHYENLLVNGSYDKAELIEKENEYPRGWLNLVVSNLIKISRNGNGLAEKLVRRFEDRGYDASWLKTKTQTQVCDANWRQKGVKDNT